MSNESQLQVSRRLNRSGLQRTLLLATAMLSAWNVAQADVLLRYDMNSATPTFAAPGEIIKGQALSFGNGVGSVTVPSNLAYSSAPVLVVNPAISVLPLNNASTALNAGCAVSFDFQVGTTVGSLSVTGLTFNVARGGANTNRGFGVYVTTPFAANVQVQPSTYITAQRFDWQSVSVNLASVAALQQLQAGDAVRITIPFWTAESVQSVEFDTITLLGVATPPTNVPVAAELRLTGLKRVDENVTVTWTSNPGRHYALEYAENFPNWDSLPNKIAASAGAETSFTFNTTYTDNGPVALLRYEMGQRAPQLQNAAKTGSGSELTPGDGLALFDVNFNAYESAPSLQLNFKNATTNLSAALENQSHLSFTFQVGSNVTDLDLTGLSFNIARGGSSTPRGYGVYVTTPTTTDELVQLATAVNSVRPDWTPHFINLTGFSSLQNLTAGQTVTFKIPVYSPSTGSSLEFDDITLRGHVTPVPQPDYVDAEQLFLRVRELPGDPVSVESATRPTGATWNQYATRTLEQLPSFLANLEDGPTSIYGGRLAWQTNATGYFYPLKIGDRWWLVDPQGCLFLHKGVAVISTIGSPGASAALNSLFTNSSNWAVSTTTLLRRHGFNGAGAWSDTGRLRQVPGPFVYTIIKNFLATYSSSSTNPGYPQVFDPEFVTFCQSYAQSFANTKNDRYLLGYFSDNELPFPSTLLTTWLALPPGNSSYDEAWRWLRERYGAGATADQVTNQDRLDFLGHVWGRYYSVVNQAIKQHDPNHLYLGSRFFSSDKDRPEIFRAIGPHVDVISVNHYSQWTPDINRIRMWEQESGKPVIITEYYVKGEDSGMPNNTGAGWVVRTQADRGKFYQNFTLALIESKVCVGWHWFKYADNDPDADADPSNIDSNKGVVSNRYQPYDELLDAMWELNRRTYRLTEWFDGTLTP